MENFQIYSEDLIHKQNFDSVLLYLPFSNIPNISHVDGVIITLLWIFHAMDSVSFIKVDGFVFSSDCVFDHLYW